MRKVLSMNGNIYLDNGYINMGHIIADGMPFAVLTGARGTGKTYGALLCSYEMKLKIIYLRRTAVQLDVITASPDILYKSINRDNGYNIEVESKKGINYIYDRADPEHPEHIGYCAALTTFNSMRSVDLSDIDLLIYDEFCAEGDRPIKEEGSIFLNMLETIGRNRELQGLPPLKVVLMSNSIKLDNPIFMTLGLIGPAIKLLRNNQLYWMDEQRGIELYNIFNSPISKRKENTALYKLVGESDFRDMALYNKYTSDDLTRVKSMNLKNYIYTIRIGELHIYSSRSKDGMYVSAHGSGTPRSTYTSSEHDLKRARTALGWLAFQYLSNRILFESYELEIIFKTYFNIK